MELLIRQISTAVTSSLLRYTCALSFHMSSPQRSAFQPFVRGRSFGGKRSHLGNITFSIVQFQRF